MLRSAPRGTNLDLAMLVLDFQSLHSVKVAADEFMKQESRLDLLINNAGVGCVVVFRSAFPAIYPSSRGSMDEEFSIITDSLR